VRRPLNFIHSCRLAPQGRPNQVHGDPTAIALLQRVQPVPVLPRLGGEPVPFERRTVDQTLAIAEQENAPVLAQPVLGLVHPHRERGEVATVVHVLIDDCALLQTHFAHAGVQCQVPPGPLIDPVHPDLPFRLVTLREL
jgi:hypothetical protein